MDSLDPIELVMAAESELRVALPDDAAARLAGGTAADLWRAVAHARAGHVATAPHMPDVADPDWHQVRAWLALRLDVPLEQVTPDSPLLPGH
jgi:hypothetical protein